LKWGEYAYFRGEIVPLAEARVPITTHALNYGTGCFEGIRGYWNPGHQRLYVVKLREHYERMVASCRILRMDPGLDAEEMAELTVALLKRNAMTCDVYIRPLVFKASEALKLTLSGLEDEFAIFCAGLGDYLDTSRGLKVMVSSWTRLPDTAIPPRAKVTGSYINACLASDGAQQLGFDEAIMLTEDGKVSEAASANLFMVRHGKLITSPVTDGILEGITRGAIIELATTVLGIQVEERRIDRTELYVADEIFLCGTGVQVAAVTSVDGRPVGDGKIGTLTRRLQQLYFAAVRGEDERFRHWLTAVSYS